MNGWIYLLIASIFEISWAVGLKYAEGFSRTIPSIWTVITMLLSFVFLSQAVKSLPIGTAYAIWTGIGAFGTALYGILFFHESRDIIRLLFLLLIISGVIGLKFTSSNP